MRHAVLIAVVAIAMLSTACQRKDKPPTPTVSMMPGGASAGLRLELLFL